MLPASIAQQHGMTGRIPLKSSSCRKEAQLPTQQGEPTSEALVKPWQPLLGAYHKRLIAFAEYHGISNPASLQVQRPLG